MRQGQRKVSTYHENILDSSVVDTRFALVTGSAGEWAQPLPSASPGCATVATPRRASPPHHRRSSSPRGSRRIAADLPTPRSGGRLFKQVLPSLAPRRHPGEQRRIILRSSRQRSSGRLEKSFRSRRRLPAPQLAGAYDLARPPGRSSAPHPCSASRAESAAS